MRRQPLGHSGLLISETALGTMTWGRDTDEHEAAEQLRDFLDAGGSLIDVGTALGIRNQLAAGSDAFAAANVMALVLTVDKSLVNVNGNSAVAVWGSTHAGS